jgi:thymidine kinase
MVEELNKWVVISGLDSDYNRKEFGQILYLIPYADTFIKQTALCLMCRDGTPGLFSHRISNKLETIHIDGVNSYIPVCRKHYIESKKN